MALRDYDGRIVRLTDSRGKMLTGKAVFLPADEGLRGHGREEDGLRINGCLLHERQIRQIGPLPGYEILRATELWQQTGAYYVRIQAMARKHHIPLRQEFDEHDGPDTRYIVVTDDGFPIATARLYPIDSGSMMIGRVVVLPEYRRQGIGTMVVRACEEWAADLCCRKTVVESRDNKVAFYRELGYEICGEFVEGDTFRCVRMEKPLG